MSDLQSIDTIQMVRRGKIVAVISMGILITVIIMGIIDKLAFNSSVTLIAGIVTMIAHVIYYFTVTPNNVFPFSIVLFILDAFVVGVFTFNSGGFITYNVIAFPFVIFASAFVLQRTAFIIGTTIITIIVNIVFAIIQINNLLPLMDVSQRVFDASTSSYRAFALAVVSIILLSLGIFIAVFTRLVSQREHELQEARDHTAQILAEQSNLAKQLAESNAQLQSKETMLRETVDALTVTALPVADKVLALPLIGSFDEQRAHSVRQKLLYSVQEQRADTVVLDLTGINAGSDIIVNMIDGMIQGTRLLGAQVILAGTQPELARQLMRMRFEADSVRSVANLAEALKLLQVQV